LARILRSPTAAILVGAAAFYGVFIERTGFRVDGTLYFSLFDDSMISMRYARNLADGYGLVWNPGQHPVEGYTNFLWTLWMAVLHLLGLPESKVSLAVMISGAFLLLANALVVGAIARRITRNRVVPILATAFTAFYYPLVYWTLRGMEVGLLALLISISVLLALRLTDVYRRRDAILLTVTLAAGVLTRTDAVIPAAVVIAYVLLFCGRQRRRSAAVLLVGGLVATVAAHTAFRLAYYGLPLPNTYYLKIQGIGLGARLYRGVVSFADLELLHLWAPTIIACAYLTMKRRVPREAYLLMSLFLAAVAYSIYVGGDAWEWMQYSNRYIAPAVPGLLVLSACGIDLLFREFEQLRRPVQILVPTAFMAAFLLTLKTWLPVGQFRISYLGIQQTPQVAGIALAGSCLAFSPRIRTRARGGGPHLSPWTFALFAVVFMIALEGVAVTRWVATNAYYARTLDISSTRYGLELRATTAPNARVAAVAVGAMGYFSHRPIIDLLGKNDHHIATEPARDSPLLPGHDKWDYGYSIGRLHPDVIAELFQPTATDLRNIQSWGYRRLPSPSVKGFVRKNDGLVDTRDLERFLAPGVQKGPIADAGS
jgi:hypothetical protein